MKKLFLILVLLFVSISQLNAKYTYFFELDFPKKEKINKAILFNQYLYDLELLKKELRLLKQDKNFVFVSKTAEMPLKNDRSLYSYQYINNFLKVIEGKNGKKGYIAFIKDIFVGRCYYYLNTNKRLKDIINTGFEKVYKDTKKDLNVLKEKLKKQENIRPILRNIFEKLIFELEEISDETKKLKIPVFTKKMDDLYNMPYNWAQIDGKTHLNDIINFILNGDKKYKIRGIKYYYENIYNKPQKLIITF